MNYLDRDGDEEMLSWAYNMAVKSPDPSSQNGAVIDGDGAAIAYGYNYIPVGVPQTYENRRLKYQRIQHAERDAIFDAAKEGIITNGATLYCPWASCRDCALAIICCGIEKVVVHKERMDLDHANWGASIAEAWDWLRGAGVDIVSYSGRVDSNPILVSGRRWSPRELRFLDT